MFRLGPLELVIILVIVILLFGVGRIGKIGKELGTGMREFRKGLARIFMVDEDAAGLFPGPANCGGGGGGGGRALATFCSVGGGGGGGGKPAVS